MYKSSVWWLKLATSCACGAWVKQAGGCCLLTTHMLEEAEYLSSHIVILRRGVVAAEGSVQALKNEWGQGYMLSIDSEESKDLDEAEAQQFVSSLLDASDRTPVKSQRHGQATYKFSKDEESLGHLIIDIARGKAKYGIRHWGISQASLEDAYDTWWTGSLASLSCSVKSEEDGEKDDEFTLRYPYLTKLCDDPALQGCCNFPLDESFINIGSCEGSCDIVLVGVGITPEMCSVRCLKENEVTVEA
eukprot:s2837_g1.t1